MSTAKERLDKFQAKSFDEKWNSRNNKEKKKKKFKLPGEFPGTKKEFNQKYGVNKETLKKKTSKKNVSSSSSSEIESDANYAKENRDFNDATSGARKKRLDKEKAAKDKKWLKNTRNSPAARAGIGEKQRLAARERHEKFKAERKASKEARIARRNARLKKKTSNALKIKKK